MPTYDRECSAGHHFEAVESMNHDAVVLCPECGEPAERVILSPPPIHWNGNGTPNFHGKAAETKKDLRKYMDKHGLER